MGGNWAVLSALCFHCVSSALSCAFFFSPMIVRLKKRLLSRSSRHGPLWPPAPWRSAGQIGCGLAVSLLRVSVSSYIAFWRASLLLLLDRKDGSQSSATERREEIKTLTRSSSLLSPSPSLSHTSLCLQPWRMSNSILACRPHPSCLNQWLTFDFATLAKKIPFFWWVLLLC